MLHMLLDKVLLVVGRVDIEAFVRDQTAFIEWILIGVRERHELVRLLEIWKFKARNKACTLERRVKRPLQIINKRKQLASRRNAVEAAHRR